MYNWGLDKAPFFVRVISMLRSTFMMGAIIPWNLHSMSVQSVSMKLCRRGKYFNPTYHMDDVMSYVNWMKIERKLKVKLLKAPTLCGPTTGKTYSAELAEWYVQGKRWTVGIAETFHFFCTQLKSINIFKSLIWSIAYLGYYNIFMTVSPILLLIAGIFFPQIFRGVYGAGLFEMKYGMFFMIGGIFQLLCIALVFILNSMWLKVLNIKEEISFIKNIFHFILSPVVIIMYAVVQIIALHEMLILGKSVCGHIPSKKNDLADR